MVTTGRLDERYDGDHPRCLAAILLAAMWTYVGGRLLALFRRRGVQRRGEMRVGGVGWGEVCEPMITSVVKMQIWRKITNLRRQMMTDRWTTATWIRVNAPRRWERGGCLSVVMEDDGVTGMYAEKEWGREKRQQCLPRRHWVVATVTSYRIYNGDIGSGSGRVQYDHTLYTGMTCKRPRGRVSVLESRPRVLAEQPVDWTQTRRWPKESPTCWWLVLTVSK